MGEKYECNCSFFQRSKIDDRVTIANVAPTAPTIGKYMTPIINTSTKSGGIFCSKFSRDFLFRKTINIKHPVAISQNLVGIRKYAADWLTGYK